MILPIPYRRRAFEFEGCAPRSAGTVTALACYKGDAAETQSNTQVGGQTGGAGVSGNTGSTTVLSNNGGNNINVNNAGTAPMDPRYRSYWDMLEAGQNPNASSTGSVGAVTNVTVTDQGALAAAKSEVQVALDAASSEVQAALDAVTAANQSTAKNTDSLITASNSTSAVIKEIAAYAALAGCGFLAYKVIRK